MKSVAPDVQGTLDITSKPSFKFSNFELRCLADAGPAFTILSRERRDGEIRFIAVASGNVGLVLPIWALQPPELDPGYFERKSYNARRLLLESQFYEGHGVALAINKSTGERGPTVYFEDGDRTSLMDEFLSGDALECRVPENSDLVASRVWPFLDHPSRLKNLPSQVELGTVTLNLCSKLAKKEKMAALVGVSIEPEGSHDLAIVVGGFGSYALCQPMTKHPREEQ